MARQSPDIPHDMQKVYRRFERWRSAHTGRLPIPTRLWSAAVELAREHGVSPTSQALRLEYGKLKRLLESASPVPKRLAKRRVAKARAAGLRRTRSNAPPGFLGVEVIQIAPQMRILVAIEAVDGRKGIDSLARLCQEKLQEDPFSGCLFVFRSRRGTSIRILTYDGQGFWLAQKRLSKGRFVWWPSGKEPTRRLQVHQAQLLLAAGNPETAAAPVWRRVSA